MKVASYIRCSTDHQDDSPEQQRKAIVQYCSRHDMEIIAEFLDFGRSGTTFDEREQFQALRKAVELGAPFRAVVCYDESRWGRAINAGENSYWRVHFQRHNVEVIMVKSMIAGDHELAPMMQAFESVQASNFSKKQSELVLRGQMNNGEFSNGGTPPFGYRRIAIHTKTGVERPLNLGEWCVHKVEKVKWVPDEKTAPIVQQIFQWRLEGLSYIKIAGRLTEMGVPSPAAAGWSKSALNFLLKNVAYIGTRRFNTTSTSKIIATKITGERYPKQVKFTNPVSEWSETPNAHEAIIDVRTFFKVNEYVDVEHRNLPRGNSIYLVTGMMKCEHCGRHYTSHTQSNGRYKYRRYLCTSVKNKKQCINLPVDANDLERAILNEIGKLVSKTEIQDLKDMKKLPVDLHAEEKRIRKQLDAMAQGRRNLLKAIEFGTFPFEMVEEKIKQLDKRMLSGQSALASLLTQKRNLVAQYSVSELASKAICKFIEGDEELTLEEQKYIVTTWLNALSINPLTQIVTMELRDIRINEIPAIADGDHCLEAVPKVIVVLKLSDIRHCVLGAFDRFHG